VRFAAIALCAAAVLVAAAIGAVLWRARRLKARHRALFAAGLPPLDPSRERLVDAPRALYHGTRFSDGTRVLAPGWGEPCVGDLFCTDQAIFLRREGSGELIAVPLAWIGDASIVRAFAPIAGKDLPMLHVRWDRGGEKLISDFSLVGGMANLEKLRREVHLRQGQGSALEALLPLLSRTPEPGSGPKGE
jgi:hypothetical protein